MEHPKDSAGKLIVVNVPTVLLDEDIEKVKTLLLKKSKTFDTINYIYVLNKTGHLKGVVSIKDVFYHQERVKVKDIMIKNLVTVRAHTDQEHVALLALRNNLKSIPVIDKKDKFLGVVPSETILRILDTETAEDTLLSAGFSSGGKKAHEMMKAGDFMQIKIRLPWLMVGLLGGIAAAFIVSNFEEMLEEELILAAFIPAVVYMADAVGSQAQTIFIRVLATEKTFSSFLYALREIRVSGILALILGSLMFGISFIWLQSIPVGIVVALSLIVTIFAASLIAIVLPLIFTKLKSDPAVATGPFATVLSDILSILIYFTVANLILGI